MIKKKPTHVLILLVEDNVERAQWFNTHLPYGLRIVHAQCAGTALGILRRDFGRVYGGIMLDYDLDMSQINLSDEPLSGAEVTDAIIRYVSPQIPILVHSMNPFKSPIMARRLREAGFEVEKIPWSELTEKTYLEWLEDVREEWNDYWDDP